MSSLPAQSRTSTRALIAPIVAVLATAIIAIGIAPRYASSEQSGRDSLPGWVFAPLSSLDDTGSPDTIHFGSNIRANQDATAFGQHEPSIAVSRVNTNTVIIASKDYREGDVKHVWIDGSTDGGATWPVQVHMPGIPAQLDTQSDPVVVARDDGRIYVSAIALNSKQTQGGVFVTWTDDNGATWHSPSVAVFSIEVGVDDKDWLAIDNNPCSPYYHRMYMVYAPRGNNVVEQHSTDGGLTWSARQDIGVDGTEYPFPVVAHDGTVYNFMMSNWGPGQTGTVQITKSSDGGQTWSAASNVATAEQPNSPMRTGDTFRFFATIYAAVDLNNGSLYVTWTDSRNFASDGTDVMYTRSTDGGKSWTQPTRLSHDPAGVVRDHIVPVIAVGNDSKVHAFWLDRRLDPHNRFFDSWYSSSTDGGTTWAPDIRVSTSSQDLNVGLPAASGDAAGDYWGLDTSKDTVYVAWNDARSGDQDILVSKGLMSTNAANAPTPGCPATATPLPAATTTPQSLPTQVPVVPTVEIPGSGSRTFPETGKTVSSLFLDYWQKNGDLAQQGYPISGVMGEVSPLDDKPYTVQYFERAVFEYHPENQPPYNILLSQLGTFRYQQKYPNGAPGQMPNTSPGSVLFPETSKRLGGKFLDYWQSHGGLAQQGYPISDEFQEKSDLNGQTYTVQYFERAVFELHPENQPPYDVLLSQLGTFRYKDLYPPPPQ